ncbi:hypothetical protein TrLO_g2586 [Triparma laevis f. longispina]|uniref:Transmembrane protein 144 n=1 Tax=Triparma laevis f. longispina TaxID=1714387 RepID=A0A9W7DVD6_9STRA|nr:hypothetical protein TrLO_g2586 [Triparma laevis f. longispina]
MASETLGYICAAIAVLFFGTNFIPVKKFDAGDGMFFQLWMCLGILIISFPVQIYRGWPEFQPFAMWGGFLWCTGNIMSVITIQSVGMSIGLLVWGATNMIMGWASGKFGLFGLISDPIDDAQLNYVGVGVALLALALYILIEPTKEEEEESDDSQIHDPVGTISLGKPLLESVGDEDDYLESSTAKKSNPSSSSSSSSSGKTFINKLSPPQKRIAGILMALVMGTLFGCGFDPAQYLMDNIKRDNDDKYPDDDVMARSLDPDPLDYVFSHLVGIFASSVFYYVLYLMYCGGYRNSYKLPALRLPAVISGMMWAVAQVCWFVANGALGFTTSFPIITSGPGLVAAICGITLFGEIKGTRNFVVLTLAFTCTVTADALIVMSR